MKRHEMQLALKAKGIKFSNTTKNEDMVKMLGFEPETAPEPPGAEQPVEQPVNKLVEILTSLTQEINNLKTDWQQFKIAYPQNAVALPEVFAIGAKQVPINTIEIKEENGSTFLTQVPVDLLKAAKEILGEKFTFECKAATDRPAFEFTVIVPQEYSTSQEVQDRRTKIIDNALGANGVREWCSLVKQNVIKTMGLKINV